MTGPRTRTPQEVFADHGTRGLFPQWTATGSAHEVLDGVDTFVFRDGLISARTVRHTLTERTK
ncbi:hypothetical protein [Streptomyces globisporus]|uniref:hypothetical protein n=1 Tax=Streptomyces globisporus TaxID=1908 RepID=UPI0004CB0ED9|nr:hypothetical protein [Streptomyces globisporus]